MHVSLCSYCTIRIFIAKTLTGTYEGGYTCVFEMCCCTTLDIVIYILLLIIKYVPLGRPRRRWEDSINMGLREAGGGEDWMELAQNRDRWRALVNTVMNLRVP